MTSSELRRQRQFLGEFRRSATSSRFTRPCWRDSIRSRVSNGRWTQASLRRNQPGETLPVSRLQGQKPFSESQMPASRAALICNNFDPHGSGTPQLHENKKFVNHPLQRITFPQASPARRQRLAKLRVVQHATDRRSKGALHGVDEQRARLSIDCKHSRNTCRSLATTGTPAWAASTGQAQSFRLRWEKQTVERRQKDAHHPRVDFARKCTRSRTPSSTGLLRDAQCRFLSGTAKCWFCPGSSRIARSSCLSDLISPRNRAIQHPEAGQGPDVRWIYRVTKICRQNMVYALQARL